MIISMLRDGHFCCALAAPHNQSKSAPASSFANMASSQRRSLPAVKTLGGRSIPVNATGGAVIGLDQRIHHLLKSMDHRVTRASAPAR